MSRVEKSVRGSSLPASIIWKNMWRDFFWHVGLTIEPANQGRIAENGDFGFAAAADLYCLSLEKQTGLGGFFGW